LRKDRGYVFEKKEIFASFANGSHPNTKQKMDGIRSNWVHFAAADEVDKVLLSFEALKGKVAFQEEKTHGLDVFGKLKRVVEAHLGFKSRRIFENFQKAIDEQGKSHLERTENHEKTFKVLIGGAGPVVLRGAIESAFLGLNVTLMQKCSNFSKVNIFMFWRQTMDGCVSLGAKFWFHTSM